MPAVRGGILTKTERLRQYLSFMRGNVLVLSLTRILGMFGRSLTMPYASLYILSLGGEPQQIGLVNSLAPLAGLLLFPIAGYLCDHMGRVKLMGFTGLLSGGVLLLYILAPSWHWIAVAALLRGLTVAQFPAESAIIADSLAPEDRGRGIALMNTIGGAPALVAPYLAGAFLDVTGVNVGMRYLYGFLMVALFISAIINLIYLKETASYAAQQIGLSDMPRILKDAYAGIPALMRQLPRSLRALTVVITVGFMANGIAGPFWVVYAVEHIGLSRTEWGLILLIELACRNIMYIPAGMIIDRYGGTKTMAVSLVLSLVSAPLFVFSGTFVAVLLIRVAVAVANAFFTTACSAFMADTTPREIRGRVMAAIGRGTVMIGAASGGTGGPGLGFLVTIPLMLSSFSAGYLYAYNPASPWYFLFGSTVISVVMLALFVRDPQRAEG